MWDCLTVLSPIAAADQATSGPARVSGIMVAMGSRVVAHGCRCPVDVDTRSAPIYTPKPTLWCSATDLRRFRSMSRRAAIHATRCSTSRLSGAGPSRPGNSSGIPCSVRYPRQLVARACVEKGNRSREGGPEFGPSHRSRDSRSRWQLSSSRSSRWLYDRGDAVRSDASDMSGGLGSGA